MLLLVKERTGCSSMQEEVGMQGILTAEPPRPAPNGPTKGKLQEGPRCVRTKVPCGP